MALRTCLRTGMAVLACALIGVAVGACSNVVKPAATAPQSSATTTPPPATPTATPTATATAVAGTPGVIGDCTAAPSLAEKSEIAPATITLACADGGIGVEDLVWVSWTATQASGTGRVWVKDCKPNCAEGKIITYPATIILSGVKKTTTDGLLFSTVTATYLSGNPSGPAIDHFALPLPPE
jgi:hypothetical protein